MDLARALASVVFPRPGTSSISKCSSEKKQTRTKSIKSVLPLSESLSELLRGNDFSCTGKIYSMSSELLVNQIVVFDVSQW